MAYDAKCPECGVNFTVDDKSGTVVCPKCGAEISSAKAIKYHSSVAENSEIKKEAHGEDYKKVNNLLDNINDLLAAEKFDDAERLINEALDITESDYRVYMALVAVKTKNFTDIGDKSHKTYINKAIEVADDEQKKDITAIYKSYYQKTKLSADELGEVSSEEVKLKKKRLEKGLKTLIPDSMVKAKSVKLYGVLALITLLVGIGLAVPFVFIHRMLALAFLGLALIAAGAAFLTLYLKIKDYLKAFNAYLDLYDVLDGIDLPDTSLIGAYDRIYDIYVKFADKDPVVTISYSTVKLLGFLLSLRNEKLTDFIENNAYFAENIPAEYYE